MTGVLIKRGEMDTEIDTHTGRTPREDEGRAQEDNVPAKERQRLPQTTRSCRRGLDRFSSQPSEGTNLLTL